MKEHSNIIARATRKDELLEYFEKGRAFTEELMKENERLRLRALKTEKELIDLKAASDTTLLNQVMEENQKLRSKLDLIEKRFDEIENENKDFAARYVEVQSQNDNLLNLYVSSYQLHSTLDPGQVVLVIQEIILNLIGAEQYFVCMLEPNQEHPFIMVGEGPEGPLEGLVISDPDPTLTVVLASGEPYFKTEDCGRAEYLACTPLKVKDDVVGAIAISKLLDHKKGVLTVIDHELLSLLSDHAATALVSSKLYSRINRKLKTVESFLDLLKPEGALGVQIEPGA